MKKTSKKKINKLSVDEIADMADRGQNISKHFTNSGTMKRPIHRVNNELNISRQSIIKTYLRQALD